MTIKKMLSIMGRNWPAKILSVALAVLLFYFYKINTTEIRYFSIPLDLSLSSGFIPAEAYPTEVRVTLRGSSESISLISEKEISAGADFTLRNKSGLYREPVKIMKSGNALYADPLEIRVKPDEIYLKIEKKQEKKLEVLPVIKGFPAENYELSSYSTTPESILVEGPVTIMEKLNLLKTETINIDGRQESFTAAVKIDLDNSLVNFPDGKEVLFRGKIEKSLVIKDIAPVTIDVINGDRGMFYELEFNSGSIKIEVSRSTADILSRENCSLYVDMKDVNTPGIYNLPVLASIAPVEGEANLLSLAPETIRVYVTKNRRY